MGDHDQSLRCRCHRAGSSPSAADGSGRTARARREDAGGGAAERRCALDLRAVAGHPRPGRATGGAPARASQRGPDRRRARGLDLTGRWRRPAVNERLKRSHGTKAPLAWAGRPGTLGIRRPPYYARKGGAAEPRSGPEMAGPGELWKFGFRDLEPALHRRFHQGEDHLDPGEVDAMDGGELADQPDALDVAARIAATLGGGPFGRDQVFALVDEERARLDVEHVGDFAGLMGQGQVGPSRTQYCKPLYPTYQHRSEEHTSELQSPDHLVCRLLLEKKKKNSK